MKEDVSVFVIVGATNQRQLCGIYFNAALYILPFCFFLLERLMEYHTPLSLVEACLGFH